MKIQFKPIIFAKSRNNKINNSNSNSIRYRYNLNSDVVFFKGKSLAQQAKNLPKDAFLSDGLREYILENIDTKNLIDLHKEYYAPLLDCQTLEEAKELYPEFSSVVDVKNLDLKNASYFLRQVSKGKIKGLTRENVTLEFLKKYIAQLETIENQERSYFNLYASTVKKILESLNISLDKRYSRLIKIGKISKSNSKFWQDDEKRALQAEITRSYWQDEAFRLKVSASMGSSEYKAKHSVVMKDNWKKDEFKISFQIAQIAKKIASLKYQNSQEDLTCKNSNIEIAKIQKEILTNWGFYDKNRDLKKILELAYSLEPY